MVRYPTFSEVEDALGDLRNDPAYEHLDLRIYWGDTPFDERDDDGTERPMLRSSGDVIESVAEVADIVVDVILHEIEDWNGADALELLDMVERAKAWQDLAEVEGGQSPDQVVIDVLWSTGGLISGDYAERADLLRETFSIWACDEKGFLLLGDLADSVQHITDIEDQVRIQAIGTE